MREPGIEEVAVLETQGSGGRFFSEGRFAWVVVDFRDGKIFEGSCLLEKEDSLSGRGPIRTIENTCGD